jgi:hypothetical protein
MIVGEPWVEQKIAYFVAETPVASFSFEQFDPGIGGRQIAVVGATVVAVAFAETFAETFAAAGVAASFAEAGVVVVVAAVTFAVVAVLGGWRIGMETALAS